MCHSVLPRSEVAERLMRPDLVVAHAGAIEPHAVARRPADEEAGQEIVLRIALDHQAVEATVLDPHVTHPVVVRVVADQDAAAA